MNGRRLHSPERSERAFPAARIGAVFTVWLGALVPALLADDIAPVTTGGDPWLLQTQATWIDQELTKDLGAFVRLSWDDGRAESFEFTEVDQSAAAGLSLNGAGWDRKNDTLGIAGVVNGISPSHQAYLAAGGTEGLILGDGALNYGPEELLETYYRFQVVKWLSISPDFQYAAHPGYNRDRGPVPIYALRAHVEF